MFMFQNYTKRLSLNSYGGTNWGHLTGVEHVVTGGVATYYVIDFLTSRVVAFNQNWIYQNYSSLPFPSTYTAKHVNGYFYFTADSYFYKTDVTFKVALNNYTNNYKYYRQMYYDSNSSKFYVAPTRLQVIQVFDTNCSLVENISLGNDYPYGLNYFNGKLYVGTMYNSYYGINQIVVLQNGIITHRFNVTLCSIVSIWGVISITFDSYGYMANSCYSNNTIILTDSNGVNYNKYIKTASQPFISQIDSSGRFVLMTTQSLDIYY